MQQGPIIPFHFIFNIVRMLFWGGIYIALLPLTYDGSYVLPIGNSTIDVEPTTSDTTAYYKDYILPILQGGLGVVTLIAHMFGFLAVLWFGNEVNSITTRMWPPANAIEMDDGFLARLDAALTLGSILAKGYAIMRAVVMYLAYSTSLLEVPDLGRELRGKRSQILKGTAGTEAASDDIVGVCRQAGSKFFQAIESGYASTAEDDISGRCGITEYKGRNDKEWVP